MRARSAAPLPVIALIAATLTGAACSETDARRAQAPSPAAPIAQADLRLAPADTWRPRGVHPIEDLTEPGAVARGVAHATIIDTHTFPTQIQPRDTTPGGDLAGSMIMPPREGLALDRSAGERSGRVAERATSDTIVRLGSVFTALTKDGWTPPDPTLAVGPDHVLVTVNQSVGWFTKDGVQQFEARLNSNGNPGFFEELGAQNFTFDPKCFYDHHAERFFILALEVYGRDTGDPSDDEATITFAVSDDADPNGVWFKYRTNAIVQIGQLTYWWDYPGFGFDQSAVYVTSNLFGLNNGGFAGAGFRAFDKDPLLAGDPASFNTVVESTLQSVQVCQHFGNNGSVAYFTSVETFNNVNLIALIDPLGSALVSSLELPVPPWDNTSAAPTPGGNVATLGLRIMNTHWRDGSLFTAHTVSDNDRGVNLARWYEIDLGAWPLPGAPTLVQSGEIDLGGDHHTYFPAVYSNSVGQLGLVIASSSPTENVRMLVTAREPDDPPGAMAEPVEAFQGIFGSSGRWGDYYDIALDPTDPRRFWAVGQTQQGGGWHSHVAEFFVPAPGECPGDVTGDEIVDVFDFSVIAGNFGAGPGATRAEGDLTGDGLVDVFDFSELAANFGTDCL